MTQRGGKALGDRLADGFAVRRRAILALSNGRSPEDVVNSPEMGTTEADALGDAIDLRSLSERYLSQDISFSNYVEHMRNLLPQQYHDLIIGYYFSGDFVDDASAALKLPFFGNAQLSVFMQTLYLAGTIADPEIAKSIKLELSHFDQTLSGFKPAAENEQLWSFSHFQHLMSRLGGAVDAAILTCAEFDEFLTSIKSKLIHVLGPDLFATFQRATDPDFIYSASCVARDFEIASACYCGDMFFLLLLLRGSRCRPADLFVLRAARRSSGYRKLSGQTIDLYNTWRAEERPPSSSHGAPPFAALAGFCGVRNALSTNDPSLLVDELLNLYNVDHSVMVWIDWDRVYQVLLFGERLEGLKISAVHWLMGQPFVARYFPVVGFAEGDGAFESALRTSIGNLEEKSLEALASEITQFQGNLRRLLVSAILSPDSAAMLAIMLQHNPSWARKLTQARPIAYDVRASALRSDVASIFAKKGLLDETRAKSIVSEEQARLRVAYLQGRQMDGVIHIDWDRLAKQLHEQFEGQLLLVKRMLAEPHLDNPAAYFDEVIQSLAMLITSFILVEGSDNIKTTISDNLRHGQLPNRFLMAFDRAVALAAGDTLDGAAIIDRLAASDPTKPHWLTGLRLDLVTMTKRFNAECLTVWDPSPVKLRVAANVREALVKLLRSSEQKPTGSTISRALSDCLPSIEAVLNTFFSDARAELLRRSSEYLVTATHVAGSTEATNFDLSADPKKTFDKHRFALALRDLINDAEQEAAPWIAIARARGTPEAFYLTDLVQLCLLNHRSLSSRQPNVDIRVAERRGDQGIVFFSSPPLIAGQYFRFFETIIRNILANAFSHSGLGLRCRVTVELILAPSRLTLISRNTVSPARYRNLKSNLPQIEARANRANLSSAGEDSGSGLQKVRWAFQRSLGVTPPLKLSLATHPAAIEFSIETGHQHGNLIAQENLDN